LAGAKRRTTAGGGALFTHRFAFSSHRNRRVKCMTCGPGPPCQRLDRRLRRRRGGALPWGGSTLLVRRFTFMTVGRGEDEGGALPQGGSTLLVRRFAFFALEDQRASCITCGAGPPCHRMNTPVCIWGDFSRCFEAGAGESVFKEGFIPRVAAMPCFSPTRGVLSPPSSLRPFTFKISDLCCHSLPWPCKFISSMPRLSGCSTWCAAYLMGCAGVLWKDLRRCHPPRRTCR
jgi:hypothetical protein